MPAPTTTLGAAAEPVATRTDRAEGDPVSETHSVPPPPPGFKSGLEGHVAFRTEIAEPDKDGGSLRYRGVDIEDLAGHGHVRQRLGAAGGRPVRPGPAARRAVPDPGAHR